MDLNHFQYSNISNDILNSHEYRPPPNNDFTDGSGINNLLLSLVQNYKDVYFAIKLFLFEIWNVNTLKNIQLSFFSFLFFWQKMTKIISKGENSSRKISVFCSKNIAPYHLFWIFESTGGLKNGPICSPKQCLCNKNPRCLLYTFSES